MTVDLWRGYRRPTKGEIPKGWTVKRLREIASFAAGGRLGLTMSNFKDSGCPAYSAEGLTGLVEPVEFTGPAVIVSSIGEKCGKSFYAENDFTTLSNIQVVFPKHDEIDPYYLWNLLNDARFWPRAQTAQPFIRPSDIKKSWIPIPGDGEQLAISELFRLTDQTIEVAQQKLLAVQRLKIALMQQLFTKGIPGRHRDFRKIKRGVIPASWQMTTISRIADVGSGVTLNQDRSPRSNGYRYLTVVNVQRDHIDLTEERYLELWPSEMPSRLLKKNDILVVEGHANSSEIGRAAMVDEQTEGMTFQNHLFRVRVNTDEIIPAFLLYSLNCERVRRHWNAICNTSSGLNTINRRQLRRLEIPKPPRPEQEEMVALIESSKATIRACEEKLSVLTRLKKYLLQNLLTGKVRVNVEAQV